MKKTPLRVAELFAGVGGFRIALEGYPKQKNSDFEVVWSNQFEPRTKKQHANLVYKNRWPKAHHSEDDIEEEMKCSAGDQVISEEQDSFIPWSNVIITGDVETIKWATSLSHTSDAALTQLLQV